MAATLSSALHLLPQLHCKHFYFSISSANSDPAAAAAPPQIQVPQLNPVGLEPKEPKDMKEKKKVHP